jgi:3'-phosphoadenosine 5'-phosphosulfate sulfotransferase (PAPS reductase)/FAD synthetase
MDKHTHIVLYSGGLGSYFAAKRVKEKYPQDEIILLFTDTKIEDEDLYVFLKDTSEKLGIPITEYSDGRDIWQVFKDEKFLGTAYADPCSKILKRKMSKKFIKKYKPDECTIYLGFDWTEMHRHERAEKNWLPYKIVSPLCEPPYLDKEDMKKILVEEDGISLPRLYKLGFPHNNCGGACIKTGIGHFKNLLDKFPERFAEWEKKEQEVIEHIGRDDISILRRTRNKKRQVFTLKMLREEQESITESEMLEIGGCGCFQE